MNTIYTVFESIGTTLMAGVQTVLVSTYGQIIIFILAIFLIGFLVKVIRGAVNK